MIVKSPILKHRVRKIPKSFSWIDHRLVRGRYIESCSHAQAALYLFLACVSDNRGLSYYGDRAIMDKLSMDIKTLQTARDGLVNLGLIAFRAPIYQVLCLEPVNSGNRSGSGMSLGEILTTAMEVCK